MTIKEKNEGAKNADRKKIAKAFQNDYRQIRNGKFSINLRNFKLNCPKIPK